MVLNTLFNQKQRPVAIVSLIVLAVGLIGSFITTIVWWTRIDPWFGKGRGIYRIVYNNVTACWILTLIALVVLAVLVALDLFAKDTFEKLTGSIGGTIGCITVIGVFSLSGLITGAYASSYALDRYHFKMADIEVVEEKLGEHLCDGYFTVRFIELMEEKFMKDEKFMKYYAKIATKAYDTKFWNPLQGSMTPILKSYMCETVGVPTLIFTMIIGISIIIFFYLIIISAYKGSNEQSDAEA